MTDANDIDNMIAGGESETCEWKKSTGQLHRAGETLCAFLNAKGGTVLFGVDDSGVVVGQTVTEKTRRQVSDTLAKIQPQAQIHMEEIPVENSLTVIALHAKSDPNQRPYLYDGRPYQRRGPTTSRMPADVLFHLAAARPQNESLWEGRQVDTGFTFNHLDGAAIQRAGQRGVTAGRLPSDIGQDTTDILRGFDLLTEDGELCNAALVLFANPTPLGKRLLQCTLQLARFKGTNKHEFLDQIHAEGGAFHLLNETMIFVRRHMPVAARITPHQLEREETPLLPFDAIREAVINAIIHRDYSDPGGSIQLAIYDDRLELWSPGGLPKGVRLDQLKTIHRSVRRNRRVAEAFFRTGHIEMWGRGTQDVVELCRAAGRDEPSYVEEEYFFGVVFSARFAGTGIVAEESMLNPLQRKILELLSAKQKIQIREILTETEASERTAQRALAELIDLGLVEVDGAGRARGYRRSLA